MNVSRLSARLAATTGLVALALGMDAASAATQMFKCVAGGRTIYQQQACPPSADPASAPTAAAASAPAGNASAVAASTAARKVKPASRAASAAPAKPR
jgi:hypothetical protein